MVSRENDIDSDQDLITEEEAVLLGSLVSEGYISENRAGFNNTDEEYASVLKTPIKTFMEIPSAGMREL